MSQSQNPAGEQIRKAAHDRVSVDHHGLRSGAPGPAGHARGQAFPDTGRRTLDRGRGQIAVNGEHAQLLASRLPAALCSQHERAQPVRPALPHMGAGAGKSCQQRRGFRPTRIRGVDEETGGVARQEGCAIAYEQPLAKTRHALDVARLDAAGKRIDGFVVSACGVVRVSLRHVLREPTAGTLSTARLHRRIHQWEPPYG